MKEKGVNRPNKHNNRQTNNNNNKRHHSNYKRHHSNYKQTYKTREQEASDIIKQALGLVDQPDTSNLSKTESSGDSKSGQHLNSLSKTESSKYNKDDKSDKPNKVTNTLTDTESSEDDKAYKVLNNNLGKSEISEDVPSGKQSNEQPDKSVQFSRPEQFEVSRQPLLSILTPEQSQSARRHLKWIVPLSIVLCIVLVFTIAGRQGQLNTRVQSSVDTEEIQRQVDTLENLAVDHGYELAISPRERDEQAHIPPATRYITYLYEQPMTDDEYADFVEAIENIQKNETPSDQIVRELDKYVKLEIILTAVLILTFILTVGYFLTEPIIETKPVRIKQESETE